MRLLESGPPPLSYALLLFWERWGNKLIPDLGKKYAKGIRDKSALAIPSEKKSGLEAHALVIPRSPTGVLLGWRGE